MTISIYFLDHMLFINSQTFDKKYINIPKEWALTIGHKSKRRVLKTYAMLSDEGNIKLNTCAKIYRK